MNQGILAARTQEALAAIESHTHRLGGVLSLQPVRGDLAHRHLHTLEAVATALAGIDGPGAGVTVEHVTEDPAPARRKAASGKER